DFPAPLTEQLKAMGYKITTVGSIGRTEVIRITYGPGGKASIDAAGDKRGDDSAAGF
ncbi:MAG: hypothetical protein JST39_01270, partial [Bacteroidetes bacterium]|nr:hypothetical protein [Bacteroidota bacterium]